ncbi:hypothetical protein ACFSTH_11890 [Paenibacillus yanchengensis]|uniref:Uncharacterized protein n=1 Tax=Paenibacillus yanchengensis TaxID=2035833 RepID=A0ABW4YK10_9BACL
MNSNYSLDEKAKEYLDTEITLLFLVDETTNKQEFNLFTVIEFRPEDQEKSELITSKGSGSKIYNVKRLKLSNKRFVYVSRLLVSVKEGLDIYRSMKARNCNLTIDGINFFDLKNAGVLTEEPPNESLVIIPPNLLEGTSVGAVLPKRKMSSKVITLMDLEKKTLAMLTTKERDDITDFANKELGIELRSYEEYIGACILRMPNPILRKMHEKLTINSDLILELFERKGKSILNGVVELNDKRRLGNGFVIRKKIDKTRLLITLPYKPNCLHTRIFDANNDLIEECENYFNSHFNISIGIVGEKR